MSTGKVGEIEMAESNFPKHQKIEHDDEKKVEIKEVQYEGMHDQGDGLGSCYKCLLKGCGEIACKICCIPCAWRKLGPVKIIQEGFVGILTEYGAYSKVQMPGLYVFNPCIHKYIDIDLRVVTQDVEAQNLVTGDSVTIKIDAVVYWRIFNPVHAAFQVNNILNAMSNLTQGTMKNVIAGNKLQDILSGTVNLDAQLKKIIDMKSEPWGVDVIGVDIKMIWLPESMQRMMAITAESQKEREAKVIQAEGNRDAAVIMKQAADEMNKNPLSLQLQYFEVLKEIATEKKSTFVLPDSIWNMSAAFTPSKETLEKLHFQPQYQKFD